MDNDDRIVNKPASWFGQVPAWVFDYSNKIGPIGIAIFTCLCIHASKVKRCFPSLETISKEINASKPAVIKYIQLLESVGLIKIVSHGGGKGHPNLYEIVDFLQTVNQLNCLEANGKQTVNVTTQTVNVTASNGKPRLLQQTQEQTQEHITANLNFESQGNYQNSQEPDYKTNKKLLSQLRDTLISKRII